MRRAWRGCARRRVRVRQDGHHAVRVHGPGRARAIRGTSRAHAGRIVVGIGRGGGGGTRGSRDRHADQRLGHPARGLLRRGRLQADGGRDPRRTACIRSAPRSTRSARSRARRRTPRCVASALADAAASRPTSIELPAHRPRFAWLAQFPWVEPDAETLRVLAQALDGLRDAGNRADRDSRRRGTDAKAIASHDHAAAKARSCWARCRSASATRLTPAVNAAIDEGRGDRGRGATATPASRASAPSRSSRDGSTNIDAVLAPSAPAHRPARPRHHRRSVVLHAVVAAGLSRAQPAVRHRSTDCPSDLQLAAPQGRDDSLLSAAAWVRGRLPSAVCRGLTRPRIMKRAKQSRAALPKVRNPVARSPLLQGRRARQVEARAASRSQSRSTPDVP